MGNICSKSANKDDSFSTPGRVLGSSAAQPQAQGRASIPAAAKPKPVSEPPRQLGTGGDASSDPRSAAARAAEVSALPAATANPYSTARSHPVWSSVGRLS